MAEPDLRLVRCPAASRSCRWRGTLLAAILVAAAGWASQVGVRPARHQPSVRALAERALDRSLEHGLQDPQVHDTLRELQRAVIRRPLDSRTRVIYASVLLGLCANVEDTAAALFHAGVAARLAPATVPVVRAAAVVLARGGRRREALEWTRRMFGHDREAAADLLMRLEPYVSQDELARGLADDPAAWLAWSRRLRRSGRAEAADGWIERAYERWPGSAEVRRLMCARMVRDGDWEALSRLVPAQGALAATAAAAPLWIYRARVRALKGDGRGAVRDIETALRVGEEKNDLMLLAGEAYEALDLPDRARRCWMRVLFRLPAGAGETRVRVLSSLARLEQRSGDLSAALRHWRAILELDPQHGLARSQIARIGGDAP